MAPNFIPAASKVSAPAPILSIPTALNTTKVPRNIANPAVLFFRNFANFERAGILSVEICPKTSIRQSRPYLSRSYLSQL